MSHITNGLKEVSWGAAIACGSFGAIHEGSVKDPESTAHCVVKVFKELKKIGSFADHTRREKEAYRFLNEHKHPAFLQMLFESSAGDPYNCIALSYFEGKNLYEAVIKPQEMLPLREIFDIVSALVEGLAFLGEQYGTHGDVKPENCLYDRKRLKIIDFGTAKNKAEGPCTSDRCTAYYRSPEGTLKRPFGPTVDAWATACIAVELITMRIPFFLVDGNGCSDEARKAYICQYRNVIGADAPPEWRVGPIYPGSDIFPCPRNWSAWLKVRYFRRVPPKHYEGYEHLFDAIVTHIIAKNIQWMRPSLSESREALKRVARIPVCKTRWQPLRVES